MTDVFSEDEAPESGQGPAPDKRDGRRLPPPAFPPGTRMPAPASTAVEARDVASAFISPDEPIPDRRTAADDAFIFPDEPIPHRPPRDATSTPELEHVGVGVVTGIGHDAHMELEELALGFDPHVREVVDKVAKLAEALKQKGEAGLRTTPDMSRFDAQLRAYCVGYLAGRRAEEEEG